MGKAKDLATKAKENIVELEGILDGTTKQEPNAQSKATKKWNEKNGVMSKSYKLKEETVNAFAEMCEENEKSQSEILMLLMRAYAEGQLVLNEQKNGKIRIALFASLEVKKKDETQCN